MVQPRFCCADCIHSHPHAHKWHMQLQLHWLLKQVQWQCKLNYIKSMEDQVSTHLLSIKAKSLSNGRHSCSLYHAPTYLVIFHLYLLGPTDKAAPPTSPRIRPFPPKKEKLLMPSCMFCCPSFSTDISPRCWLGSKHQLSHCPSFFFSLPHESPQVSTNQTQGLSNATIVPRICWAKHFGSRTQLQNSLVNCLNQVGSWSKSLVNYEQIQFTRLFPGLPNFPK